MAYSTSKIGTSDDFDAILLASAVSGILLRISEMLRSALISCKIQFLSSTATSESTPYEFTGFEGSRSSIAIAMLLARRVVTACAMTAAPASTLVTSLSCRASCAPEASASELPVFVSSFADGELGVFKPPRVVHGTALLH